MPRAPARPWLFVAAGLALALSAVSTGALAHAGFGGPPAETRFAFPPWAVWAAGALVVAATFAVVGVFLTRGAGPEHRRPMAWPERPPGVTPARAASALVVVLVIANAFLPRSDSLLPETSVWLVAWALLPLLSYALGDLWPRVSPFEALPRRARPAPWPERLGSWPATVLFLALVGAEVAASPWVHEPVPLARLVALYVLVTAAGTAWFGAAWLRNVEVVTRSLRWWASAAPVAWGPRGPRWIGFGRALARLPVHRFDDVAFTVAVLFGVNFDGFVATPLGASALEHLEWVGAPAPLWMLLALGYLVFLTVWLLASRAIRNASGAVEGVRGPAVRFAASLLPIAVGYHLAHNLLYLVEHAPRLLVAVLDPLGLAGWPAFPVPAALALPASSASAAIQVAVVLAGHVVAVLVAHHLAGSHYAGRVQALRSEVPLTVVMVVYTWLGLWILSGAHAGGAA